MVAEGQSGSLARSTAVGVAWSGGTIIVTTLMQIVYSAVMARLLAPADFGLVAAALLSLRFVSYLSTLGIGSAVVQRDELSAAEGSAAFKLSSLLGLSTAAVALLGAPLLASIVRQPAATNVTRWMAVGLLIGAVSAVPEALLRRRMQFRGLSLLQVLSYAIGYLGVGITLAVRGWGVWSLVTASLAQGLIQLIGLMLMSDLSLKGGLSLRASSKRAAFGGAVTVTGFLEFLQASIDTLAVGRWAGAAGLGQYSRATYMVGLPVEKASSATTRVLLSSLSRVQNEPVRFGRAFSTASSLMACVVLIPTAMIAVAAPAVVAVVLGPGWGTAASVLPVVSMAYALSLLTHFPAVAAESLGLVRRKLWLQAIALAVTLAAVGAVVMTGPSLMRLATAWGTGEVVRHLLYWRFIVPKLGPSIPALLRRYGAAVVIAATAAVPLLLTVRIWTINDLLALFTGGFAGLALAFAVSKTPVCRVVWADLRLIRTSIR